MRIILTTLARCWILIQAPQNPKDTSDVDSDEGPLRKRTRLTLDCRTAVSATMDRLKKDSPTRNDVIKSAQRTRDVGVLCCERVSVHDKCIMVGTTGIDALKAKYGDDFTNFEIIQDVGYSSESSTHLSGDDTGADHFNVRIYKFSEDNQPLNLKEELEAAAGLRDFYCLGSSVESSSSAAVSLNDSGLGAGDTPAAGDSGDVSDQFRVDDEYEQEGLDYLETVLDECIDFGANAVSEPEELHFSISGIESDDPSDNFHNRRSFTTSAQVFYKMISVDSDNGDRESPSNENNTSSVTITETSTTETTPEHKPTHTKFENCDNAKFDSESDPETFKPAQVPSDRPHKPYPKRQLCSTPMRSPGDRHRQQGLKRKRNQDPVDASRRPNLFQSWLKVKDIHRHNGDVSSCDASCECTSSSADEGNVFSSSSTFFDDDVLKQKLRVDCYSAEGSVETVLHALLDSDVTPLHPPPSLSASCCGGSKTQTKATDFTICCRLGKVRGHCKVSSDSDLNRRRRNQKEMSMSSSRHILHKHNHLPTSHPCHRQYSSLPSILGHPSDSSTDDNCIPSTQVSHSDAKATDSVNRSSSSEKGGRRRRSRKKSSSSNRSSASVLLSSGDRSRHRSRTLQSSTSSCGSRRRNRSQLSEFFCAQEVFSDEEEIRLKVDISPVEEQQNVHFEDLGCSSSVLLSPIESDIVLTHLEEQSTVSDQVWDGYQEMPYLSEGYSEATVDEDAIRKLTEFGDDYGSAIGQPLRLLDTTVSNKNIKIECKKSSKCAPAAPRLSSIDSDSDTEDFHYFIEEAGKALNFSRATLKRRQDGETFTSADYAELLATCGEHLRCLQTICEHINVDLKKHNFSSTDVSKMHCVIEKWQHLKKDIEMYQETDEPSWQKFKRAQENIEAMFNKMSQISSCSYLDIKNVTSREDIHKNLTRLQMVLTDLQEAKEQLLAVNLQVHRFTTQYCHDDHYRDSTLKYDVTELYRQWEDVYEQNGLQLTELETLMKDWEAYEDQLRRLRVRIKEVEWNLDDDCDSVNHAEGSVSLRQDFDRLEIRAFALEGRLKDGEAWKNIDDELRDLKRRIGRHGHSNSSTFISVKHRSPSTIVEEDADDNFEDAIQQLCDDDHSDLATLHNNAAMPESGPNSPKKNRMNRFWRIVRMAVPVQLALVLLYCLACYMEPSCCNMLNNFNFSFTPQLRYFGGHPPV